MALEDSDEAGNDAKLLAIMANQYTSPEAQALARGEYDKRSKSMEESVGEERAAFGKITSSAEEAKAAIRAARQKLLEKRYNKADMYFAMAQAFGSPTRTGAFGETIGNVAGSMREPLKNRREWEDAREKQLMEYGLAPGKIDQDLASIQMRMAAGRRDADAKLIAEAMKILGKEVRPRSGSSAGMSPFGKIAADEGLPVGTPQFNARVNELYNADMEQRQKAAGVDTEEVNLQDLAKNAYELGVPTSATDPFAGLSIKGRQTAMAARARDAEKTLAELAETEADARRAVQQADRFVELNKEQSTGPAEGWINPSTWFSDAGQEMRSITAQMARTQRVPGEGQISNFDANQFIRASMSVTKDEDVNKNLARGIKAVKQTQLDFVRFMNDYYMVNRHLVGAKEAWHRYVNDNPVYDPAAPGELKLNKNRKSYQEYFKAQMRPDEEEAAVLPPAAGWHAPMALPAPDNIDYEDPIYDGLTEEQIRDANVPAMAEGGRVEAPDESVDPSVLKLENIARAMMQGATANFSDEMLAQLSGQPYDEAVHDERALLEELSDKYPIAGFSSEVAGALPVGIAGGAAVHHLLKKAAGKRGKVAQVSQILARALPKSQLGKMATAGGAAGVLGGVGASQDDDPVGEAISGGLMGATLGPLGGYATKFGKSGVSRMTDRLMAREPISVAEEKLLSATAKDDLTLMDLANKLRADKAVQVPSTLGDTGGKHMQALTEAVVSKPGEGPARLVTKLDKRQAAAGERASDQVNRALAPDEYFGKEEALKDALYTQAKPLYEAAYQAHPGVSSKAIFKIMETPDGKRAVKRAMRLMENDGIPIGKANVAGMVQRPSLQFLDYVKRGLDGLINTEERQGATDLGHSLRSMRNRLRDELDNIAPEYKVARQQYAGDLEVLDALKMGREQFGRLAPQQVRNLVQGMSFSEKDALRTGVAESLFQQVMASPPGTNVSRKIMGTPAVREKVATLFPKATEFKKFMTAMDREMEIFEKSRRTLGRAEAARAREATEELGTSTIEKAADAALDVGANTLILPGQTATYGPATASARVMGWLRKHSPTMTQKTAGDLSRMLGAEDPAEVATLLKQLEKSSKRVEKRAALSSRAATAGAGTMGIELNPDPHGNREED